MKKSKKEIFEKFEKLSILGEGADSKVYKVREISTGKLYALKRIRDASSEQTSQEISILKSIKHPNVIKIHNDFLEQGNLYLLLELAHCKYQIFSIFDWGR